MHGDNELSIRDRPPDGIPSLFLTDKTGVEFFKL